MVSSATRQPGRLLAGVTSLATNGSSASEIQYLVCPMYSGRCVAVFETMTGPGNRESDLANASSTVLFWLVSSENDPDHSLSRHNLCPLVVAPKEGAFNLQISSFPSDRPNQRSLVVNKNIPRLSKEGTSWSYENSFVFCPLTPPTSSISISDMWH